MTTQPIRKPRGPNKVRQAFAGVAGALAFLGIGWAMGTRSAASSQTVAQPTVPATAPTYPITRIPGEWDDEGGGQWGTIPQQGGTAPALPGTNGGTTPPQTGTTGSTVAQSGTSAIAAPQPGGIAAPLSATTPAAGTRGR